ncbi:MAG: acyl-CoA dehydrogenase family protein [Candidatus Bathyarchaeia archaeon]
MDFELTEEQKTVRHEIRRLAEKYPASYWREKDLKREYPTEFTEELAKAGWLGAVFPEQYGGGGLGTLEASIILEELTASGAGFDGSMACHAVYINSAPLIKHWTDDKKQEYLPKIASGELRLQTLAITEQDSGFDTTKITTSAARDGDYYIINGKKVFISRLDNTDLMLMIVRTTPREKTEKRTKGMSLFLADLRKAGNTVKWRRIHTFCRHAVDTNEIWFNNFAVPADHLIGKEGEGFYQLLDVLNPERIYVAAECVGLGRLALQKAAQYAKERIIFDRPIGKNQAIAHPLARAFSKLETADLMRYKAAWLFDRGLPCGKEANIAKLLASEAAFEAADRTVQTLGGYGFAEEYDVERYFRESRLTLLAPISTEMVLNYIAEHVLGLPRSY